MKKGKSLFLFYHLTDATMTFFPSKVIQQFYHSQNRLQHGLTSHWTYSIYTLLIMSRILAPVFKKKVWKLHSRVRLFATPWTIQSMEFSRPEYWSVGSLFLLQGIFPTQGSNPGLPHCRWILYQLGHKGSPRILEWVVFPFSSGSSQPRNWPGSPALQVDSLPTELWGKPCKWIILQ